MGKDARVRGKVEEQQTGTAVRLQRRQGLVSVEQGLGGQFLAILEQQGATEDQDARTCRRTGGIPKVDVTFSLVHMCRVLLCHLCICVHFLRALESQAKRCFHIVIVSGCTDQHTAQSTFIGSGACYRSFLIDPAACTNRTAARTRSLVPGSEKDLLATA